MLPTRPLSILVIEDDQDCAVSLAALLRLFGHTPRVADTGEEAVRVAFESATDVVILDIGLPGLDGITTARRLREASERRLLLIALTGHRLPEDWFREAGFDRHLVKPVEPTEVRELLQDYAKTLAKEDLRESVQDSMPEAPRAAAEDQGSHSPCIGAQSRSDPVGGEQRRSLAERDRQALEVVAGCLIDTQRMLLECLDLIASAQSRLARSGQFPSPSDPFS